MLARLVKHAINNGWLLCSALVFFTGQQGFADEPKLKDVYKNELEQIKNNRNNPEVLATLLPIVHSSFQTTKYERILLTQLRNKESTTLEFRDAAFKSAELLIAKVVETLSSKPVMIETPLCKIQGEELACPIELVTIMRSGDALLETFMQHFPCAHVSKLLIQRDEVTSKPDFKYMKLSKSIASGHEVVITEPMIATGGTLDMAISLLKKKGVLEENITIASFFVAPEGLLVLGSKYPKVKVVMLVMDDYLNERNFIVPGVGDFGDRFFGTTDE